jgi:hypothetical protein
MLALKREHCFPRRHSKEGAQLEPGAVRRPAQSAIATDSQTVDLVLCMARQRF